MRIPPVPPASGGMCSANRSSVCILHSRGFPLRFTPGDNKPPAPLPGVPGHRAGPMMATLGNTSTLA